MSWLRDEPPGRNEVDAPGLSEAEGPALSEAEGPALSEAEGLTPADRHKQDIADFLVAYDRICPDGTRKDGWSPFSRKLFLSVLAETGRVSTACEYTRMSRQSVYALRARDPLFAAGWDAACELARTPLADALYEKALDGITETIVKDGQLVATRHRFDSRLSIAVLNRLDKRCDRAEERGSRHLAVLGRWEEWLGHVGNGEDDAARAMLEPTPAEPAPHCQNCQLPEGENPIEDEEQPEAIDLSERFWTDEEDGLRMTDFPPPPGFDGYQQGQWGDEDYERECTPGEIALLPPGDGDDDDDDFDELAEQRADDEALRDALFAMLRERAATAPSTDHSSAPGVTSAMADTSPPLVIPAQAGTQSGEDASGSWEAASAASLPELGSRLRGDDET